MLESGGGGEVSVHKKQKFRCMCHYLIDDYVIRITFRNVTMHSASEKALSIPNITRHPKKMIPQNCGASRVPIPAN